MSLIESNTNGVLLEVKVTAESLDASNAGGLKDEFSELDLSGLERVVVDLEKVGFIDSSGIGALLNFYKQTDKRLSLRNPSPTVMSVLELLRLHRVFEIENS